MRIRFWLLAGFTLAHLVGYATLGQAAVWSYDRLGAAPAELEDSAVRILAHLLAQPFAGPILTIGEGEWHRPLLNSLVWGFGLERGVTLWRHRPASRR